jgi:hypothetical protein
MYSSSMNDLSSGEISYTFYLDILSQQRQKTFQFFKTPTPGLYDEHFTDLFWGNDEARMFW